MYADVIALSRLFQAWYAFRRGKAHKPDVQVFERHLENNLFALYEALRDKTYRHGQYVSFYVADPKRRHIHKATVADRVIHHLLYAHFYGLFDKAFIYDSYSCRIGKGTHKAVHRLVSFVGKASGNYSRPCWALQCDIKQYFATVDHQILVSLLRRKISDRDIMWLLSQVIESFHSDAGCGKGIPLGNLTSQIFANIYLNELDQFIKHQLRVPYYLRYADDFLLLSIRRETLDGYLLKLVNFLKITLRMELHPKKIRIRRLTWGIDFVGYIVLPHCVLPRTKTKHRMFERLEDRKNSPGFNNSLQSYLGYLSHANAYGVSQTVENLAWLWRDGSGNDP